MGEPWACGCREVSDCPTTRGCAPPPAPDGQPQGVRPPLTCWESEPSGGQGAWWALSPGCRRSSPHVVGREGVPRAQRLVPGPRKGSACTSRPRPPGGPAPRPSRRALYSSFLPQPCFLSAIRHRLFIMLSSNRIQTRREELVSAVPAQQLPYFQPSEADGPSTF